MTPIDKFSQEFGHMQSKLDQILENQKEFYDKHGKLEEKHDKMDSRIRSVESKLNWYAGSLAAIGAGFTFAGDKIRAAFFGS